MEIQVLPSQHLSSFGAGFDSVRRLLPQKVRGLALLNSPSPGWASHCSEKLVSLTREGCREAIAEPPSPL